jgi:hypothetical protein
MNPTTKPQSIKCENKFLRLLSSCLSPLVALTSLTIEQKDKSNSPGPAQKCAALLAAVTGRFATLSQTSTVNSRFFVGAALLIASPWIKDLCFLFDPKEGFPLSSEVMQAIRAGSPPEGHWYYVNWHWFLATIDDPLTTLIQFIGIFFFFPAKYSPSYFIGIPVGYNLGTIIWFCFCTSPKEVNTNAPWSFALMGIALTGALIFSYEYLVHRYYHTWLRCRAAIIRLVDLPNTDKEIREHYLNIELDNVENFQSRLF